MLRISPELIHKTKTFRLLQNIDPTAPSSLTFGGIYRRYLLELQFIKPINLPLYKQQRLERSIIKELVKGNFTLEIDDEGNRIINGTLYFKCHKKFIRHYLQSSKKFYLNKKPYLK